MMNKKNFLAVFLAVTMLLVSSLPLYASGLKDITTFEGGQGGTSTVGDNTIYFGSYWQGENKGEGKSGIQWRVLKNDAANKQMLLLSDKALYADQFDGTASKINQWANSEVRATLNSGTDGTRSTEGFAKDAFKDGEWSVIDTTDVKGDDGETTISRDKLFLLSQTDVKNETYGFEPDTSGQSTYPKRQSEATIFSQKVVMYDNRKDPYGDEATVWVNSSTQKCVWWLGSPGLYYSACVLCGTDG